MGEDVRGLDAGHLIGARHMGPRRGKRRGGLIHLTHRANLSASSVGSWGVSGPTA